MKISVMIVFVVVAFAAIIGLNMWANNALKEGEEQLGVSNVPVVSQTEVSSQPRMRAMMDNPSKHLDKLIDAGIVDPDIENPESLVIEYDRPKRDLILTH